MWCRTLVIWLITYACVWLVGCQGTASPSSGSNSELLYILNGGDVVTYAVDPTTLQISIVNDAISLIPASASLLQLVPTPDDHFLYALWTDVEQHEYISAFATDALGVPLLPPVQILDVANISQLNIHPGGSFAYAMQLNDSPAGYTSRIRLFRIAGSGKLRLNSAIQGVYGPSPFPTLLYGLSPKGNQIYLTSPTTNGMEFWEWTVTQPYGILRSSRLLWQPPGRDSFVLGAALVVDYQSAFNYSQPQYVNILSSQYQPPKLLIHCTSVMLSACAAATNVQLDPSGKYLFLTDPTELRVRLARIDLSADVIVDTGESFPFTAQTPGFAFSPDGKLVYALLANDSELHIYGFDPSNGHLSGGGGSISVSSSEAFLPAMRR